MDDRDDPSDEDIERFSDVTRTCPACKKEVYDDASTCYHCGEALSEPHKSVPLWAIVLVLVLAIGLTLTAIF